MTIQNITFEGARLVFRNFSGVEGQFNRKGDRNFCLILEHDAAEQMAEQGWNIKTLKPREEDELPQPYIQVTVKFPDERSRARPPKIVMLTSRGKTPISEEMVDVLDWAEFSNVDLIIRPYEWEVNGKTGVKAYVKTLFVTIQEDDLDRKYIDVPDSATNVLGGAQPLLAIEGGDEILEEPVWGEEN